MARAAARGPRARVSPAVGRAGRPPWSQYPPDEGPGSGLYRSGDGGKTWAPVGGRGLPAGPLGRIGLAAARGPEGTPVYPPVGAPEGAGLYRSPYGRATRPVAPAQPPLPNRNLDFCPATSHPPDPAAPP